MKRIVLVAIGFVLVMGCATKNSSNGSVSGKVTYNGKPVNGAILRLYPASGEGGVFNVGVSQEGNYQASDVPPGEYKIVVEGSKPPPEAMKMPKMPKNMDPDKAEKMQQSYQKVRGGEAATINFPNKYKSVRSTDLKVTIVQGKSDTLNLDLKD